MVLTVTFEFLANTKKTKLKYYSKNKKKSLSAFQRIFMSGLGRKAPPQSIGRYFMLPHEHSWDFKPHSSLGISTSDPVFREIRIKYNYSRLDELGAKPTDWSRDGLNNLRYTRTGFSKNEDKQFMKLDIDVSTVRLSEIAIEIDGEEKYQIGWNFEKDRLKPQEPCFIENSPLEGAMPEEHRSSNETDFSKAKEKCSKEAGCSSILFSEKENLYFLNEESVLLGSRRLHESFGSLVQEWHLRIDGYLVNISIEMTFDVVKVFVLDSRVR